MSRRPSVTRLCNRCHATRSSCLCAGSQSNTPATCPSDSCSFSANTTELKILAAHVNCQHSNSTFTTARLAPSGLSSCPYCHQVYTMSRGWILHSRGCAVQHQQNLSDVFPGTWPRPGWLWNSGTRAWSQVAVQISNANPRTSFQIQTVSQAEERKACLISFTDPSPAQSQSCHNPRETRSVSSPHDHSESDEHDHVNSMDWLAYAGTQSHSGSSSSESEPVTESITETRRIRQEQDEEFERAVTEDLAAAAAAAGGEDLSELNDGYDSDAFLDDDLAELDEDNSDPVPISTAELPPLAPQEDRVIDSALVASRCSVCFESLDPLSIGDWSCCHVPGRQPRVCAGCTSHIRTSADPRCPQCRSTTPRLESCAVCLGPAEASTMMPCGRHRAHQECKARCTSCPPCSGTEPGFSHFNAPPRARRFLGLCNECGRSMRDDDDILRVLTCNCWGPGETVHEVCARAHHCPVESCPVCQQPAGDDSIQAACSCFQQTTRLHAACVVAHHTAAHSASEDEVAEGEEITEEEACLLCGDPGVTTACSSHFNYCSPT